MRCTADSLDTSSAGLAFPAPAGRKRLARVYGWRASKPDGAMLSGECVGKLFVVNEPDLIGCIEIKVTRDDDAVFLAVLAEHVRYQGLRPSSAQEPKKVLLTVQGQSQIDFSSRLLFTKAGTQLALLVFVLFDVALGALGLGHPRILTTVTEPSVTAGAAHYRVRVTGLGELARQPFDDMVEVDLPNMEGYGRGLGRRNGL